MYSCHGVFTNQFIIFLTIFGANLEYLTGPTNQWENQNPENGIFDLLTTSFIYNVLMNGEELPVSWEKVL